MRRRWGHTRKTSLTDLETGCHGWKRSAILRWWPELMRVDLLWGRDAFGMYQLGPFRFKQLTNTNLV